MFHLSKNVYLSYQVGGKILGIEKPPGGRG